VRCEVVFNKKKFAELLLKAIGGRTATNYADLSGVNRTYISKLLNEKLNNPPSPEIIKRLTSIAHGGVEYRDLMIAAGHWPEKGKAILSVGEGKRISTDIVALIKNDNEDIDIAGIEIPKERRKELADAILSIGQLFKK
jgi:transcriptional regulator with XRE-family HTH domain